MLWTLTLLLPVVSATTFTVALLAPFTGSRRISEAEVWSAVNVTLEKIYSDKSFSALSDHNYKVHFSVSDTECDRGVGIYKFVEMVKCKEKTSEQIHAVIGPSCDRVCESVGLLAGRWKMPVISYGCFSEDLSDRKAYPTLVRTTGSFDDVRRFLRSIVTYFKWKRITLVTGQESAWLKTAADTQLDFRKERIETRILQLKHVDDLIQNLPEEAKKTRVFILFAYGEDIHHFMINAHKVGLVNGKYVFVSINYANMAVRVKQIHNSSVAFSDIFRGLLDITVDIQPERRQFKEFMRNVQTYRETVNDVSNYENGIQVALIADAVYLYLLALNNCIAKGGLCSEGSDIAQFLYGNKNEGVTGTLIINKDGTRQIAYMLHNIRDESYVPIARSDIGGKGFQIIGNIDEIIWPGGSTEVPKPAPVCGWENELCIKKDISLLIGSVVAAALTLVILVIVGYTLWKRNMTKIQLEREDWRINRDDIMTLSVQKSVHSIKTLASFSKSQCSSSLCSTPDLKRLGSLRSSDKNIANAKLSERTTLAVYDNQKVVLKSVARNEIPVTKDVIIEINAIRQLLHPNVNTLIGAYIEPGSNGLVWHYCPRGSLHDVLLDEDIKLDWVFNISFATDIARAMLYIQNSVIETHGRLKSSNVLIDSHWDCKVTDMAMPNFSEDEQESDQIESRYFKYLWTAPEMLRNEKLTRKGTKKGDVYAFAIIIQEILSRSLPYGDILQQRGDNRTVEQILNKVKNVEIPPYRPLVRQTSKEEGLLADVMRLCWDEIPASRPTFQNVLHLLTKLNKGRKTNILDQMIHRMTKYSEHLENMIQERTTLLNEEKKKTDQILSKMLPKSVIEDLKLGKTIEPESFPSVTVFFSDVVGFTKMAAESTPYEVVNFLNSLYTMFDYVIDHFDVYKVETIGDGYMVVSGLPKRNGIKHAGEICSMSLQLLRAVDKFKIAHRPDIKLELRIGIHSGPVVAGVVGQTMPRYCLFGDTVNYASRMESSGEAMKIHVSTECKKLLEELGGYHLQERGEINLKGKGRVVTYFLIGKDGFVDSISASEISTSINVNKFK